MIAVTTVTVTEVGAVDGLFFIYRKGKKKALHARRDPNATLTSNPRNLPSPFRFHLHTDAYSRTMNFLWLLMLPLLCSTWSVMPSLPLSRVKRHSSPYMMPAPISDTGTLVGLIDELCTDLDGSFYGKHSTDDFHFVRPSGNPLTAEEYSSFVCGGDVSISSANLVTLHVLDVGDIMAFAVVTQAAEFTFQGTPNNDVFVANIVFKKVEDRWLVALVQRSSGRAPSDPKPEFRGFTQSGTRRYPFPFGS